MTAEPTKDTTAPPAVPLKETDTEGVGENDGARPLDDNGVDGVNGIHGINGVAVLGDERPVEGGVTVEDIVESKKGRFAYFRTRHFWIVLLLGCVVSYLFFW